MTSDKKTSNDKIKLSKKVLLISTWAPPGVSGGPHLLYNLFSGFDDNSYCLFTSIRNFPNKEQSIHGKKLPCKYFFFEEGEVFKVPLFPYIYTDKTSLTTKIYQKIRRGILKIIRAYSAVRSGLKIVRDEKIEVIMGTSDFGPGLLLTFIISKLSRTPYILFLCDLYRENNLPAPWKTIASLFEGMLISSARIVINHTENLGKRYMRRYGEPEKYRVIPVCIDERNYANLAPEQKEGHTHTIVFTGNIYWAQRKSLENMIAAVSSMNDLNLKFKIYTPEISEMVKQMINERNDPGHKTELGTADLQDIPYIQSSADILFLPLSWQPLDNNTITSATPYKLIEYLLAAKPILIQAPPNSYLNQYAEEEGFAYIANEDSVDSIKVGIRKILRDKNYSEKLINSARATFKKNHHPSTSRLRLIKIIEEISVLRQQ